MGGDHAASGFEIADLDAKTQHSAQIVGRLQQKGMDGTGFRQTDIVVGKRGVEVDGFPFCQKVVFMRYQHQAVGTVGKEFDVLAAARLRSNADVGRAVGHRLDHQVAKPFSQFHIDIAVRTQVQGKKSEEHTSELQSLMRISYAVFCLKKKKQRKNDTHN